MPRNRDKVKRGARKNRKAKKPAKRGSGGKKKLGGPIGRGNKQATLEWLAQTFDASQLKNELAAEDPPSANESEESDVDYSMSHGDMLSLFNPSGTGSEFTLQSLNGDDEDEDF